MVCQIFKIKWGSNFVMSILNTVHAQNGSFNSGNLKPSTVITLLSKKICH